MSKAKQILVIFLCLFGLIITSSQDVSAFEPLGNTWGNSRATMSLNLNRDDPVDQAGQIDPWNRLATDALARWNDVPGSRFSFFFNRRNEDPCDHFDFFTPSNAVEWAVPTTCAPDRIFSRGTLAVTIRRDGIFGGVNNADVLFNRNVARGWTSADPGFVFMGQPTSGAGPINFNSVAMHEFGHVLGLNHENRRTLATMNSIYHPNPHRLHADDRGGVRSRYLRARVFETDIGPSNWTKRTSSASVPADLVSAPASAVAGDTITMEWTQENFGNTPASFNIGFFLSTDNVISPSQDILLGRNIGASQPAGTSATFQRSVTIPAGTPGGIFFLGVCLDDDNTLVERFEENNCLAHPRFIVISAQPVGVADLEVGKDDNPDPVVEGEALTYTVTVTNNGPDVARSVTLIDNLPARASFLSATASQGTCSGGTGGLPVTCQLGGLTPSTSATVTIVVRARGTSILMNNASVFGDVNDPNPGNNIATEDTPVLIP